MRDEIPLTNILSLPGVETDCSAVMKIDGQSQHVRLVKVTRHGLVLNLNEPPQPGTKAAVTHGSITIHGEVEWSHESRCLLLSRDEIDVPEMIGGMLNIGPKELPLA